MKKPLNMPPVSNNDQEHDFWSNVNLADYLEAENFESAIFPNLKPTSQPINLRLPIYLLYQVKQRANSLNVPYQALIKQFIADGLAKR